MICKTCGKDFSGIGAFCPYCGTAVTGPSSKSPPSAQEPYTTGTGYQAAPPQQPAQPHQGAYDAYTRSSQQPYGGTGYQATYPQQPAQPHQGAYDSYTQASPFPSQPYAGGGYQDAPPQQPAQPQHGAYDPYTQASPFSSQPYAGAGYQATPPPRQPYAGTGYGYDQQGVQREYRSAPHGTKIRKSIFTKWWFYLIIGIVVLAIIGIILSSRYGAPTNIPSGAADPTEQIDPTAEPTMNPTQPVDTPSQPTADPMAFDADEVISQIELTEYSYVNSIKTTWIIVVLKNNSRFNLDLTLNLTMKDADGNIIGAKSKDQEAFESGTEIALAFYNDKTPAHCEYDFTVEEEEWYDAAISDLSYEATLAKRKVIVSATNTGEEAIEFAEATVLFFKGDKLVSHRTSYFTDNEYEIKPGKTISEEISCGYSFDSVKVYFTGRR